MCHNSSHRERVGMSPEKKLEFIFNDVFWRCGDCNNIYFIDLKSCPNKMLDAWLILDVVTLKELKELG
jgi:hypothetical protein